MHRTRSGRVFNTDHDLSTWIQVPGAIGPFSAGSISCHATPYDWFQRVKAEYGDKIRQTQEVRNGSLSGPAFLQMQQYPGSAYLHDSHPFSKNGIQDHFVAYVFWTPLSACRPQ